MTEFEKWVMYHLVNNYAATFRHREIPPYLVLQQIEQQSEIYANLHPIDLVTKEGFQDIFNNVLTMCGVNP